jgi:hypothetical protein
MRYIVITNPTLRIVGPFQSKEDARRWGRVWQNENEDNPCWQTIDIEGEPIAQLNIDVERPNATP